MANLLTYTEIWTKALDQQAIQQATSGWMEVNSSRIQYNGGKTVKVPTLTTTGLGDYARGTGAANRGSYAKGSVNLSYQDLTMTQDRSAEFAFDRMDVDETGFIVQAPAVAAEFQRSQVIPELDAYRYSKIAATIMGNGTSISETISTANVFDAFLTEIRNMQDKTGIGTTNLVAVMPYPIYSILERSAEVQRQLKVQEFTQGGVNFEVSSINGIPIIPVVSDRMMTEYEFYDGASNLGFAATATAKQINWIITPRDVPIAVSKTDNLKVFAPETNQNGDDWLMQYRKYHDLWLLENRLPEVIVSIAE